MAWVKLDDAMPHHPKVMAAGVQGFALDVAALCYANKHMTDGLILRGALPAVLPSLPNPKKWAARLVEVGRWEQVDEGWRISGYEEYQPTKAEQKAKLQSLSDRGVLGNHRRWHVDSPSPDCPYCNRRSDSDANPPSRPVPSRPDSDDKSSSSGEEDFNFQRAIKQARGNPKVGNPTGYAKALARDPLFAAESERLWAHRECTKCSGKGVVQGYAEGSGGYQVQCAGEDL